MKIRIRGDSIRLRLTRSEVEKIRGGQSVHECTYFGHSQLTYRLELDSTASAMEAHFENQEIKIRIPHSIAVEWATSEKVSLAAQQSVQENRTLSILIEKDFFCLKPRSHPEYEPNSSDYFENPNHGNCS